MNLFLDILIWGLAIGAIHFVAMGILYTNPIAAKIYKDAEDGSNALKKWDSQKAYMIRMVLGTQVEVFILTGGYIFLRQYLEPAMGNIAAALVLAIIFTAVRVYPRFWNMWIQTTYPRKCLTIEFINGTAGTFLIVFGLMMLPV